MNKNSQKLRKSAELFGAILGGLLISLPAIPQALAQQSAPKVKLCPSIFYEEPHNNRVVVPQGCPPNALTQRLAAQGLLTVPATSSPEQTNLGVGGEASQGDGSMQPSTSSQPGVSPAAPVPGEPTLTPRSPNSSTTQPLLPPQQQTPNATIALANGKVNIRLVNDTATNITYQVVGDTAPRSLQGKSDVTLQALNAPVSLTFQREDGGQLLVTPQPSSEPGSLEVTFKEATDANQGRSAMRIEQNGSVYLN